MNSQNDQVLFVGQLFPDSMLPIILDQEILPIQTQRFGEALLAALRSGFNDCVEVVSTAPLLDFPHSKLLFGPGKRWIIDGAIKATMLPFLNLTALKHVTRFIATFLFVSQWILKTGNSRRIIILLGAQSCKLWGVLLACIFRRCITITYLTDDLGIPLKWERTLIREMRLFDVNLLKKGLQKVSGVIAMTPNLAEKLALGHSTLVMPTIRQPASNTPSLDLHLAADNIFNIMYTGNLSHSYGLHLLLDAFKQANHPNWSLLISGWGEMEDEIRDFSRSTPHVEYFGLLNAEELSELRQRAHVFVNPKLTSTARSSLAFPSKIVEYLGAGKPVISTDLPIFDDAFRKHLIIARSDSPEELIRCLEMVESWGEHQLKVWCQQSLNFVNEELSPAAQGARIRGFVDTLKYEN